MRTTNIREFKPKGFFGHLSVQDWSWVHFKIAMITWAVLLFLYTPIPVAAALGVLSTLCTVITAIGGVVSLVGLFLSVQPGKKSIIGLTIELAGISFMAAGPFTYFVIQIYLAATLPTGDQRYALIVLAYAICAALMCRLLIVYPKRARLTNTRWVSPITKLVRMFKSRG